MRTMRIRKTFFMIAALYYTRGTCILHPGAPLIIAYLHDRFRINSEELEAFPYILTFPGSLAHALSWKTSGTHLPFKARKLPLACIVHTQEPRGFLDVVKLTFHGVDWNSFSTQPTMNNK